MNETHYRTTILHITEVSSGGVLPVIISLCNGCADEYDIYFAYGIRPDTPNNIEELFDKRIKIIKISSFTRNLNIRQDLKAAKEIKDIIRKIHPDIIHFHSTKAGFVGRLSTIFYKGKKLYTPHGYSFLKQDENRVKREIYKIVEYLLAKTGSITVACGERELKEAKKIDRKAICIENGIDTTYIDSLVNSSTLEKHHFTIYTAGRIGPQKNPWMFNEIAKRFSDIQFVWIGGGKEEELHAGNITVTGFVARDDVIRFADGYDCYLSCSLWEGLPIALEEAMYMGKICIVSNIPGNNELIDNECGFLFRDIAECEEQIRYVLNSREPMEYGNKAKRKIIEKYTQKDMLNKYKKLIGGGNALDNYMPLSVRSMEIAA